MAKTLANGYSSERSQRELSNEYQQGLDGFQKSLCPCALDESGLSIGKVKLSFKFCIDKEISILYCIETLKVNEFSI